MEVYGVQPEVGQFQGAGCMGVAGEGIYHPFQDSLTRQGIAFGGDFIRLVQAGNYLILEEQAQGFPGWAPYKGQLRL